MNILLCGLPKSGKSTIGKLLAKKLNKNFIDTDREIEKSYVQFFSTPLSCKEIYAQRGEVFFRNMETIEIYKLKNTTNSIIALGGGALEKEKNHLSLSSLGCIIYLQIHWEIAWNRMQKISIPSFLNNSNPKDHFYQLSQTRISTYEKLAHHRIMADHCNENEIIDLIHQFLEKNYGQ